MLNPINISKFNPIKPRKPKKLNKWLNETTYIDYLYRLQEIAINMFDWSGLPDTIDARYLELTLCENGMAVYFNDEEIGNVCLSCMIGAPLNIYRVPIYRRAYSVNGYQKQLTDKDSVIIFNNYLHTPSMTTIELYARRLAEIDRTIDVNVHSQKTPMLILCDEAQRLTLQNVYKNYDDNDVIIFGAKNLDIDNIKCIKTDAPYVADKLYTLKRQIWNEAMTFFGVENANTEKKERLVTDEISSNLGGVEAQRIVMLNARRQAADQINKMFGTNITVKFRSENLTDGGDNNGVIYDIN